MLKIKVEKIEMYDSKYFMVYFYSEFTENEMENMPFDKIPLVDLSRNYTGSTLYPINNLQAHNEHASSNHTKDTVDSYIRRVLNDVAKVMGDKGIIDNAEIEKVRLIIANIPTFPSVMGKN